MTVKDGRPLPFVQTGPFQARDVRKLCTVINCYRLKYFAEQFPVSAFKAVQGGDDASGGLVLHFDHDFLPGLPLRQDQKGFLRLLLAFDTVHFPVSDLCAVVDLRGPLFYAPAGRRPGGRLLDLLVLALLHALAGKVGGFQGQEHTLLDVGIQGRFTDRRVEPDSLDLDFAQDGGRGIAVLDDPAFNVRGQAVILAYFQARPLRGQVFPVCGFGYVRAIPFFFGPVRISVDIPAPFQFVVNRVPVDADFVGDLLDPLPTFQERFDPKAVVPGQVFESGPRRRRRPRWSGQAVSRPPGRRSGFPCPCR